MTGTYNPGSKPPATAGGHSKPRSPRAGIAPERVSSGTPRPQGRAGIAPERVPSGTPRSPDRAGIAPGRVSTGTPRPQGRAAAASGRQRQVTQAHSGRCSTDNEASADPSNTEPAVSSGNPATPSETVDRATASPPAEKKVALRCVGACSLSLADTVWRPHRLVPPTYPGRPCRRRYAGQCPPYWLCPWPRGSKASCQVTLWLVNLPPLFLLVLFGPRDSAR